LVSFFTCGVAILTVGRLRMRLDRGVVESRPEFDLLSTGCAVRAFCPPASTWKLMHLPDMLCRRIAYRIYRVRVVSTNFNLGGNLRADNVQPRSRHSRACAHRLSTDSHMHASGETERSRANPGCFEPSTRYRRSMLSLKCISSVSHIFVVVGRMHDGASSHVGCIVSVKRQRTSQAHRNLNSLRWCVRLPFTSLLPLFRA
jgi:hypothetical protein